MVVVAIFHLHIETKITTRALLKALECTIISGALTSMHSSIKEMSTGGDASS